MDLSHLKMLVRPLVSRGGLLNLPMPLVRIADALAPYRPKGHPEDALEAFSPSPAAPDWSNVAFGQPASVDLSVIVPAFNVEKYVGECVESIVGQQTEYSVEVIVVNDGSTDGTKGVLNQYRAESRVRIIDQTNGGFSAARNIGLDSARGRAIMFVDSDDCIEQGYIQQMLSKLESSGAQYVISGFTDIDDDGKLIGRGDAGSYGTAWGKVYRRGVWDHMRFPVGYWYEDTVLAFFVTDRLSHAVAESYGYRYRHRSTSISHSDQGNPKSMDTYWIARDLLKLYLVAGNDVDARLARELMKQLGPLMVWRTRGLDRSVRQAAFEASCQLYRTFVETCGAPKLSPPYAELQRALMHGEWRSWNYVGWCSAMRNLVGILDD